MKDKLYTKNHQILKKDMFLELSFLRFGLYMAKVVW